MRPLDQLSFAFNSHLDLLNSDPNWINRMYHRNCLDRQRNNMKPFKDAKAYYERYQDWLNDKYREEHNG